MIKKITFLLITIILSVNNLAFSQIDNPYLDFNPEELKNNKNYTKNFNPGNFDQKILYNCMIDMINLARLEYAFVGPLKHNISLDSTAQMQADFQAKKDEKTEFNEPPYRTTYFRLKKFGFTNNGIELVSKAKASLGALEYSYYDLCVELIKPILKNLKQARLLLDKQYTYIGFGYETDTYMRSMYASFILGNDRTFNDGKPSPTEKELPYTKGKGNLQLYDPQICQKCNEDKNLEVLSEYIQVKGNDVYLVCDDHKSLKRLIGKDGDAIVLDFVQHSQYNCDGNVLDNDRAHRGFITKPIIFEKIIAANEIADKKSTKLSAKIAVTPEMMD
ncbi:MAG: CAP domain-containing protein, partial [Bacteroidales bacterium]